jgi:hypothetical protein
MHGIHHPKASALRSVGYSTNLDAAVRILPKIINHFPLRHRSLTDPQPQPPTFLPGVSELEQTAVEVSAINCKNSSSTQLRCLAGRHRCHALRKFSALFKCEVTDNPARHLDFI